MEILSTASEFLELKGLSGEKCPYLDEDFCRISGTQQEMSIWTDKNCCYSNEWNKCSIYITQFYYDPNDNY